MAKIKVRVKLGSGKHAYYGSLLRFDGDVFYIDKEEDFSKLWMERVTPKEQPPDISVKPEQKIKSSVPY